MRRKLLLLVVLACLHVVHLGNNNTSAEIRQQYKEANTLFYSANPTAESDERALQLYGSIIQTLEKQANAKDTILFFSYLRQGVLLEVQSNAAGAQRSYLKAIAYKQQLPQLTDSVLFSLYLYTGATCYHLNNYDSARLFFDRAETLLQQYPGLPERERLYNSLGALYYEAGDYHQSKNYFTKALQYTLSTRPTDNASIVNFQNNIAACLNRLQLYKEALVIYHDIIKQKQFSSHIYQNMGFAYRNLGEHGKALHYFNQADPSKATGVKNELAYAYIQLKKYDSAAFYLDQSMQDQQKKGQVNRLDKGLNHLYRAELFLQQGKATEALAQCQQAIISFSSQFNKTSIYANPGEFAGSFASYKLFEALRKKGRAFRQLYDHSANRRDLEASLNTMEAAISLLRYIERSYETDDARLFLKKNAQQLYRNAFNTCMQLYNTSQDRGYLEKAFVLTEQNKASVLAVNVNERNIKRRQGIPASLLQQESYLRYNIARLNLKSDVAGAAEQEAIAAEKLDFEIALSKLVSKYEKASDYYNLKYKNAPVKLGELQTSLAGSQALISFYADDSVLHAFVVTRNSFNHLSMPAFGQIEREIAQFVQQLKTVESGRKFNAGNLSAGIYRVLVDPVMQLASTKQEWIIIPDGILHYLPFEALQQEKGGAFLLQSRVISYHFSAELLRLSQQRRQRYKDYSVLAFAPFAGKTSGDEWQSLPSSQHEISQLPGRMFYNEAATRANFMREANTFPVVHLATHAVSNTGDPGSSYISFYPADTAGGKLYLEELYGIEMDSALLVIISACESGDGQLVNSEGVISLSRGFAYAGCKSMVTSLWKANDRSTAMIIQKFHAYLRQGYARSEALQKAKLDYINAETVHKTPNYWAHLVLIGDTEPLIATGNSKTWMWILAGPLLVIPALILLRREKRKKKSTLP
jgi:CHAT domain-containing protein